MATPVAPSPVEDVVIPLSIYGDPLEELAALLTDRRELDREIAESVAAARAGGVTWAALAGAFGVTRQAVQKRYGTRPD